MDYGILLNLHRHYEDSGSLVKTASFALETYDIDVTRHQLAKEFKQNGLHVNPPNGRPDLEWYDLTTYRSPESNLAADLVVGALRDFVSWPGSDDFVGFITAACFIGSETWEMALAELMNASNLNVGEASLGDFLKTEDGDAVVDVDLLRTGQVLYEAGYQYWVAAVPGS